MENIPEKYAPDLRSIGPTHTCICGCTVFETIISFEDYFVSWWFLEGTCINCDAKVTLPCPVDKPSETP